MESDLSRYEITSEGMISPESTSIFNSSSRQGHVNSTPTSALPPPPPGSTPRMPTASLAADNQMMTNYISSPHPDLPNQYNIIIAGDDVDDDEDDVISQTLNSPQASAMDLHHQHSISDHSLGEQSMGEQSIGDQGMVDQSMGDQNMGEQGDQGMGAPYRSYTIQFKLNALDWYYKNGENKNLTAKMFSVDRKRIRDWLLDEKNLRCNPTPQRTKRKRANSLPQYKDIEDALYKFYLAQREKGIRPKNAELRAKSLEFASVLGYRETFKASIHWLCNWKRRNKISFAAPEQTVHNTEDEDDSGAATPPFVEERLGKLPQTYKGGHVGNYGNIVVDSVGVSNVASGNGSVGYGVVNRSSGIGGSQGGGRLVGVDSMVAARSSNGTVIGTPRVYGGGNMAVLDATVRSAGGHAGGNVGYSNTGLEAGMLASRNVGGVDGGGLTMATAERRREAVHHISEDPLEDGSSHNMGSLAALGYSAAPPPQSTTTMEQDASEHWMELLEQSVLSLESDVARRFSQIKLLLQQFKKSRQSAACNNSDTPNSSTNRLPAQGRTQTK